jgi:cytochrome c553
MNKVVVVAFSMLVLASGTAIAGDSAAGKEKSKVCAACHGEDGSKTTTPDFPRLAGQYRDYLVKALQDYKSGARNNPIMAPQAANLSVADIEDLAAYYSRQSGLTVK